MKRDHVDAQPAPIGAKTATHLRLVRGDELPSATDQPYVRGMAGAGIDRVSTTIEALIARFRRRNVFPPPIRRDSGSEEP